MNRLLSADFTKLKKNRFFWFCTIGMFLFGIFMTVTHHIAMVSQGDSASLTNVLFIYAMTAAVLIPAFVSLFIGTEYSDGTIRNKIVVGHFRTHIYLSNLITCSAAGLVFCLSYAAGVFLVGIPLTGIEPGTLQPVILLILCSLVTAAAFSSLCTVCAMLCQSRSSAAVINILAACFFLVLSIYILNRLSQPETYSGVGYNTSTGAFEYTGETKNPDYLDGTEREVYQFFNDFLPTGQAVNISSGGAAAAGPGLLAAYSACIVVVSTGTGIFLFRKKDLR